MIAFLCVHSYNQSYNASIKLVSQIEKECNIKLKVTSYPTFSDGKTRVICEITDCPKKELIGKHTRLSIKNPDNKEIRLNDVLEFSAVLSTADENALPGAFSYRAYLKSIDVCSQCYVEYKNIKIHPGKEDMFSKIYDIRNSFLERCDEYLSHENAGLIKAVTTGDRTGIESETEENLKIAGVYHIVAISGLHLNIFIGYLAAIMAKLRTKRLTRAVLSSVVCLLCAGFVLIFTGIGVSVIRAFSMLVVMLTATIISREYNSKNSLILSAIVIVIFTPYNIYNTAFQLSFLSTLGVLISADIMNRLKEIKFFSGKIAGAVCQVMTTSVMTTLLTLPVTVQSFGYIPLFSWLANLIILPLMGPLIGCAAIFAVAGGLGFEAVAKSMAYICNALSECVIETANFVASLDYAYINICPRQAGVIIALCAVCIIGVYTVRKHSVFKGICLILIFTAAFTAVFKYNATDNTVTVHYANVGQGDGAVIITPENNAVLIDCGEQYPDDFLSDSMISFLRSKNIHTISLAFVSHFHTDHISALSELAKKGRIEALAIPAYYNPDEEGTSQEFENLLRCAAIGNTKLIYMKKGTKFSFDSLSFNVLSPDGNMFLDNNNMSAVIKMTYGKSSFLFTGDIESEAMAHIYSDDIGCDVMKIAHHGSKSGCVEEFFDKASPQYAVISCGKNNSYGHPDSSILKILEERNITVFRTDTDGGITFTVNKENIIKTETMR